MMRYLSRQEVLTIHRRLMGTLGGSTEVREPGLVDSAVAQPRMTFGGQELYRTLVEKASSLMFSLVKNYPFLDGNRRVGHAATEVFLLLNGHEIDAAVEEQDRLVTSLAGGELSREELTQWLQKHVVPRPK